MARHKEIHTVNWTGETLEGPRDLVMVLHPSEDPERRLFLTVSPTNARRLQLHLDELLDRSQHPVG